MPEPLNILMITHHRRNRAAGRSLVMARHLVQRGHRATVITTAMQNRVRFHCTMDQGVRVVEAPDLLWGKLRSGWDPWAAIQRVRFLSQLEESFDLVHCFETRPTTIYPALYYARRKRLPLFTDWNDWFGRGGLITILRPAWYRFLLGWLETYYEEAWRKHACGTTVIATALGERAARLGIAPERILRIPGGAEPEKYPRYPKEACRAHMGYPAGIPILGFASADSHLDMELIFSALKTVARRFPTVRLIITGNVPGRVLESAQKLDVRERLILPGFLPLSELPWCLGSADAFLLPYPETIYNLGRWPNKIGLYLCLGRPIITNPVGDVHALLQRHPIGFLADCTGESFAGCIIDCLEHPEQANAMGENAYRLALSSCNWKELIVDLEDFYYRILETDSNGCKNGN